MNSFGIKTPTEAYYVGFDFTNKLGTATVSSAVVTVKAMVDGAPYGDAITAMVDAAEQSITSPYVYVWIQGGSAGWYIIECEATASDGSVYEGQGALQVAEVK